MPVKQAVVRGGQRAPLGAHGTFVYRRPPPPPPPPPLPLPLPASTLQRRPAGTFCTSAEAGPLFPAPPPGAAAAPL